MKKPLETQGKIDKILESKPISAPKHPSSIETIEKISRGECIAEKKSSKLPTCRRLAYASSKLDKRNALFW